MKGRIIEISKGQYLIDIMKSLPENAIIAKTLPGIGATYCEIMSERNSIIIEPNVPVIIGKSKKHQNLLAVYEGINKDDVINYINSEVAFKKIITTPESYKKVQTAFKQLKINYFDEYFLLIDEYERIGQDIGYREAIYTPMEDFWKFKNRSFITATPINMTSKEFEKHNFEFVRIKPDFDYKLKVRLFFANNVLATVKETLSAVLSGKVNVDTTFCFFINSVYMIHDIITDLDLKDSSNIYCSEGALLKFQKMEDKNVFNNLNDLKMNKFNFFTSRFYSSVDIEIETQPAVIIVSDVKFASYSMVDPRTEIVQIAGRFRNGIRSLTHITNTDDDLPEKSTEEVKFKFKESEKAYSEIRDSYDKAPNEHQKKVWKDALERVDFAKYLTSDKNVNWFKLDNELANQRLINSYLSEGDLVSAYRVSNFFNIDQVLKYYDFPFNDNKYFREHGGIIRSVQKEIVAELENLDKSRIDENVLIIERLRRINPLIVDAYFDLGKDFIEKNNYNNKKIWTAMEIKGNGKSITALRNVISKSFNINRSYTREQITTALNVFYREFGLLRAAKATHLHKYFELSPLKTIRQYGREAKGYTILSAKFPYNDSGTITNFV